MAPLSIQLAKMLVSSGVVSWKSSGNVDRLKVDVGLTGPTRASFLTVCGKPSECKSNPVVTEVPG